jgi:hypothetical protein
MGAKSAVLGFALSCRTQRGGFLRVDAPQVEHLFKTVGSGNRRIFSKT